MWMTMKEKNIFLFVTTSKLDFRKKTQSYASVVDVM